MTDDEIIKAMGNYNPIIAAAVKKAEENKGVLNTKEREHLDGLFRELMLIKNSGSKVHVTERIVDFLEDKFQMNRLFAALVARQNSDTCLLYLRLVVGSGLFGEAEDIIRAVTLLGQWHLIDCIVGQQGVENLN